MAYILFRKKKKKKKMGAVPALLVAFQIIRSREAIRVKCSKQPDSQAHFTGLKSRESKFQRG